ncbi:unnamed protein product [Oppiella nova]|uniref:Uncharacterized protein n=1 Tax=Oppiella nova TaxID=334625 RepID=A0A7R9LI24_9ACAR|nr:unnamed protein product [Oppiella nova]CAG2163856.1 unnamed protein product [Oppiella nova]
MAIDVLVIPRNHCYDNPWDRGYRLCVSGLTNIFRANSAFGGGISLYVNLCCTGSGRAGGGGVGGGSSGGAIALALGTGVCSVFVHKEHQIHSSRAAQLLQLQLYIQLPEHLWSGVSLCERSSNNKSSALSVRLTAYKVLYFWGKNICYRCLIVMRASLLEIQLLSLMTITTSLQCSLQCSLHYSLHSHNKGTKSVNTEICIGVLVRNGVPGAVCPLRLA